MLIYSSNIHLIADTHTINFLIKAWHNIRPNPFEAHKNVYVFAIYMY